MSAKKCGEKNTYDDCELVLGQVQRKEGCEAIMTNTWKMVSITAITPAD